MQFGDDGLQFALVPRAVLQFVLQFGDHGLQFALFLRGSLAFAAKFGFARYLGPSDPRATREE